ncbi:MAG: hypothetical protein C0614_12630 [Desulfuromonas sp.]|nr:MAG: hypothetical protein C0614_12630 [Desulfuromonas sp.]
MDSGNRTEKGKKHPCSDCRQCQWCSDDRCRLCLKSSAGCRKKLSMAEQIALFEQLNRNNSQGKD